MSCVTLGCFFHRCLPASPLLGLSTQILVRVGCGEGALYPCQGGARGGQHSLHLSLGHSSPSCSAIWIQALRSQPWPARDFRTRRQHAELRCRSPGGSGLKLLEPHRARARWLGMLQNRNFQIHAKTSRHTAHFKASVVAPDGPTNRVSKRCIGAL